MFQVENHQKAARAVRAAFPNLEMRMVDWTNDLGHVIVQTSGNKDSGTYFAVDLAAGKADAIAYERLAILPDHVGPISKFDYVASDGMELDGVLTLPPGREASNLPVVILPHGGPHSHDNVEFDWWAQAFASRGYAVLQPNFRGSTNRDSGFRLAGYGEWGRKMQTDKSDGLAALAQAGIVDPERACIVGASYGGYAALAGVTLQQGIYRCAVAVAPVSDIADMYREDYRGSGSERTTKVALLEQLGPRESWNAVSPLRAAARADAPIMLIHGKDDVVVPYSHSLKMADKLKDAGKPYEMVTLDGEDHWLSLSGTRQLMLEQAVRFVEQHNPPD
ncbi:S9 family peptidase [Erythrobacter sp. JK5]|uniref:alpha/beta hydrolase family protein n=1 Tax=Erythrobacter sp. JK5 TaxID=2829500 RepID=UPI002011C220|nr:alpha/beta fold hydrolase [Erythrobacter sp. JK5]